MLSLSDYSNAELYSKCTRPCLHIYVRRPHLLNPGIFLQKQIKVSIRLEMAREYLPEDLAVTISPQGPSANTAPQTSQQLQGILS